MCESEIFSQEHFDEFIMALRSEIVAAHRARDHFSYRTQA